MATLFMLPWLAAGMASGRAWASAPHRASTMRVLVSTLPAATAAGRRACTSEPSGARMRMGRKAPQAAGVPSGMRQRKT